MSDFIESSDLILDQNIKTNNSSYCKNEYYLNENENKAVDEFLARQNWPSSDAINWNIAVKFLMARKFDVDRAVQLYAAHESLRRKENLHFININDKEFLSDLETGKFTILPFLKNYPVCALFTVKLHTQGSATFELKTLQTLIYQLDAALENPDAQRNGIIFIYDMNNCKRANYDLALSQKILTLIKGSYPARLNKLFVVSAPFWFKCLVKVLSVLMRDKLRDRVTFVTNDELKTMVPIEILPNYLGGNVKLDHKHWLKECYKLITNKTSTCHTYYCTTKSLQNNGNITNTNGKEVTNGVSITNSNSDLSTATTISTNTSSSINRKRPSSDFIDVKENVQKIFLPNKITNTNGNIKENAILNGNHNEEVVLNGVHVENGILNGHNGVDHGEIDVYLDDDSIQQPMPDGMTIVELVEYVKTIGVPGLLEEYRLIKLEPLASNIDVFNDISNLGKNRYRDVPCLDDTRVKLVNNKIENDDQLNYNGDVEENYISDYIHANYVDGYKQKNAYISTQGPLDDTCEDFWQMVWQEQIVVIVMTTKCLEQRRKKCAQYWPNRENDTFKFGIFEIENKNIEDKRDFIVSKILLKNLLSGKEREIMHCQFVSWPDHGIPQSSNEMLEFVHVVRHYQANLTLNLINTNKWHGHPLGPPILVHCSAGIGRTGTFCTIDININRLLDTKKINIRDTVSKIRSQRALSVQMPDQYVFCYMAIIEYAIQENLLDSDIDLTEMFS